jgi:hypothetical protein
MTQRDIFGVLELLAKIPEGPDVPLHPILEDIPPLPDNEYGVDPIRRIPELVSGLPRTPARMPKTLTQLCPALKRMRPKLCTWTRPLVHKRYLVVLMKIGL